MLDQNIHLALCAVGSFDEFGKLDYGSADWGDFRVNVGDELLKFVGSLWLLIALISDLIPVRSILGGTQ